MSFLSFIFDRPTRAGFQTMNGTEKVLVEMDASIQESHRRTATVTQNPIEDGSNIADHVKLNPQSLTVKGIFSEVPLSFFNSVVGLLSSSAANAAQSALPGIGGAILGDAAALVTGKLGGLLTGTPRDPIDAVGYLEELWEKREPFTMVTAIKKYEDMVITNLDIPRNAKMGGSLFFTVTLEQIKIAKSAVVQIPAFKVPDAEGASSSAELGKQAGKETSESTENRASLLLQGFQGAGVLQ